MSGRQLTPEQLALSRWRKEQKLQSKESHSLLYPRQWLTIPSDSDGSRSYRVKLFCWNLLAQCLIRRELFPSSSCLKANQREPMIHEEIMRQDADILCLQEVDRVERLLPKLEKAGYSHLYASGPKKLHGCLVAFKKDLYSLVAHETIYYDDHNVPCQDFELPHRGNSFNTRNIGFLVALHLNDNTAQGIVIATTHLFWHPRYTYERIRQLGILIRETEVFRKKLSAERWPCVIAGDFNFTPKDAAYSLLFGDHLLSTQENDILESRVVHATVDPTVLSIDERARVDDDDDAPDPDLVITNARPVIPEDRLLTIPDIIAWFAKLPKLRSAYCEGLCRAKEIGFDLKTYGSRETIPPNRQGFDEPEYTSYTYYWKSVLDYIFFMDADRTVTVTGLAEPLSVEVLEPGVPKRGISGSDHIALIAEITWEID